MVTSLFTRVLCVVLIALLLFTGFISTSPVFAMPPAQDTPPALVYGQTVDGRIDRSQPSVFYAFQAGESDVVTITMIATSGELDPFVVLNDATRTPLVTDDNSGDNGNARLTFIIPTAGQYIIQATHAGGVPPEAGGTFSLNLTASADAPAPGAVPPAPSDTPTIEGDSVRLMKIEPGTTTRDTLNRQVALRYYWFEGQAGDQISLTPQPLGGFQALYVLYDATFAELKRAEPGTELRASLPHNGPHILAVALPDPANAGGEYAFTYDHFANPAAAGNSTPITYGETQQGNIDAAVTAATYRFNGTVGDTITIIMRRAGGDLNSYLYLLDSNGQLLFEDNDSGGTNGDAQITFELPTDGAYVIVATRLGQAQGTTSGSYIVELQSDAAPPAQAEEPVPTLPAEYASLPQIAYGDTVEGTLSNAKFMDFYVFFGHAGDLITIEMLSPTIDTPTGLDPLLILLDHERIPLVENDDIVDEVERESRIEYTLTETNYYAIVATRFEQESGATSGPYTLTLSGPDGAAVSTDTVSGSATPLGQLDTAPINTDVPTQGIFGAGADLYTFSAAENDLLNISITTDPGFDSILVLADENLNEVLSSGTGALTDITIPKAGQYTVLVAPRFGPVNPIGGAYSLTLTQTAVDEVEVFTGPRAIAYGDTVNGLIDETIISQVYTFSGTAGERVRITMEATPDSTLDCYLELQDATGAVLDQNDDIDPGVIRDSQIIIDLPADGTYTLIAARYVGPDTEPTTGRYRLTLDLLDEDAVIGVSSLSVPLVYGQTEVAEINDEQYLLFFVFDGTAGDTITIEVGHLTGNLDSVLHLYQSVGDGWIEIDSNDDSPTGGTYAPLLSNVVLPQTGKYLIAINRYGLERETSYGTFALTLTLVSNAGN